MSRGCPMPAARSRSEAAMTAPSPAQPRQTRRYAHKREAILDAAVGLFNRKGIRGATLSDVAQGVGLITNSVTYYYRRKEDLAAACFLRTIAALDGLIAAALGERTAEERLRALLRLYFAKLAAVAAGEHPPIMMFSDIRALTSPQVEVVFGAYTAMFRHLRGLFQDGADAPGLSRADTNARTHLLLSLVHGARGWVGRYETEDYGRAAERMADILLRGLAAGSVPWAPKRLPPLPALAEEGAPEAFLLAATRLINEQGYRGASVDKISAQLQVTKGSFYHHNDNKDDLVAACFARSFAVVRRAQLAAASRGAGWDKLCDAAAELVRFQLSEHGPLLRSTAFSALPETLRSSTKRTMDRLSERFAGFAVDGMVDGSIRPVDPSIAAHLVNDMINAAAEIERWVPGVAIDTVADLYARPLFCGLLAPTPGASPP